MLEAYLNAPSSMVGRLLSETGKTTAATRAARKRAMKIVLAEWQRDWDKLCRENDEG
jgi:hypothetical protein